MKLHLVITVTCLLLFCLSVLPIFVLHFYWIPYYVGFYCFGMIYRTTLNKYFYHSSNYLVICSATFCLVFGIFVFSVRRFSSDPLFFQLNDTKYFAPLILFALLVVLFFIESYLRKTARLIYSLSADHRMREQYGNVDYYVSRILIVAAIMLSSWHSFGILNCVLLFSGFLTSTLVIDCFTVFLKQILMPNVSVQGGGVRPENAKVRTGSERKRGKNGIENS